MTAADVIFSALASPVRRRILDVLGKEGPQAVNAIAALFLMERPSISEHLKVLRDAGLVSCSRIGREHHYQLNADPLREISRWLAPFEDHMRGRPTGLGDTLETRGE
ncbi:ArsR/SmtB family transcription factor [Streptomyces sp. NBC_00344]|uniref:ArsR/SmtB family transcription factor n=1 Tax=Streptomyces sp. NBC_00344 TaxID=2975720 RepID=UPI002E21E6CE